RETRTIPIVFVNVSDPVALLKEIAPDLGRAALVADPKSPVYDYFLRSAKAAAPSLAIALVPAPVENAADIEHFFDTFTRVSNGGLLLPPDIATYFQREFAEIGGLMSYGTSIGEANRLAGVYVGRVLKGEKPADLPVMQSIKFEFVINLNTANA